jgi:hypothetical protein
MGIAEIADLFDIFYQTAKRNIRAIEKSSVASGNYSMSCIVEGQKVYPEYYGLELIISVAFRVQSEKAAAFREFIVRKATADTSSKQILIFNNWNQNAILN